MAARYERDTKTLQQMSRKFRKIPDKNNTSKERRKASYNAEEALNIVFVDTNSDSESYKSSERHSEESESISVLM